MYLSKRVIATYITLLGLLEDFVKGVILAIRKVQESRRPIMADAGFTLMELIFVIVAVAVLGAGFLAIYMICHFVAKHW